MRQGDGEAHHPRGDPLVGAGVDHTRHRATDAERHHGLIELMDVDPRPLAKPVEGDDAVDGRVGVHWFFGPTPAPGKLLAEAGVFSSNPVDVTTRCNHETR